LQLFIYINNINNIKFIVSYIIIKKFIFQLVKTSVSYISVLHTMRRW